jgi:hypothetical protein
MKLRFFQSLHKHSFYSLKEVLAFIQFVEAKAFKGPQPPGNIWGLHDVLLIPSLGRSISGDKRRRQL